MTTHTHSTPDLDLDHRQYAILTHLIKKHLPHHQIWAYGSRVKRKGNERSDLDLVVFGSDLHTIADFQDALTESDMIITVDVMDWETIPDDFKANIKRKYIVLQETTP